jgi:hypothetical protein
MALVCDVSGITRKCISYERYKSKGKGVPVHIMKGVGGVEVQLHSFLTSALDGGEWSASRPYRFTPEKEYRYPLNRRLGGPQSRSGRFGEEKKTICLWLLHQFLVRKFEFCFEPIRVLDIGHMTAPSLSQTSPYLSERRVVIGSKEIQMLPPTIDVELP